MIRIHRDALGIELFDVRFHNSIHTFLSFEEAKQFLDTDRKYLRASAVSSELERSIGKAMKPQRIKWTEQRGNSGN